MTFDVPSEYEDVLRQAVATGAFANEQDALRHALQLLADEQLGQASVAGGDVDLAQESPYEKATRLRLIGAASGLPADLSSNEQHMQGFGRS